MKRFESRSMSGLGEMFIQNLHSSKNQENLLHCDTRSQVSGKDFKISFRVRHITVFQTVDTFNYREAICMGKAPP